MQKTESQQTGKNRQEILNNLTEQLEKSVQGFMDGEKYKNFLSSMARFHSYSLNNQLLIHIQKPDSILCASYTTWKKFDRYVKKGEKGIKIICPSPHKTQTLRTVRNPKTGKPELLADGSKKKEVVEKVIPFYNVGYTYDISQTDGEPLPEITARLNGDLDSRQNGLKAALLEISPVPVHFRPVPGEANGYYNLTQKEIVVDSSLSEKHSLKTLIHELAHVLLHDSSIKDAPRDSPTREVQAESVAYVVCQYFGIDTSDYSFGYISTWSSDKNTEELKKSLEVIRSTSNDIIANVEKKLSPELLPQQELSENIQKARRRCM